MFKITYAGSSNDGIVRRVTNSVLSNLEEYESDELFYIIGWSSPERKDFYYKIGLGRVGDIVSYNLNKIYLNIF